MTRTRHASRGDSLLFGPPLLALAVFAALTPIRNYDFWYHLATGEWILAHHAIPSGDIFSFTTSNMAWVDHEWLFQLLLHVGHQLVGAHGLVLIKVGVVLLIGLLLAIHLRREGHGPSGTVFLLVPTLLGASFRFDVRPELATLALLPLVLHLVMVARKRDSAWPLYVVPAIVVLWANLHAGVIMAPAILAVGLVSTCLVRLAPPSWLAKPVRSGASKRFVRRLAWLTAAVTLAIGLNPFGFRIYTVPFKLSALLASLPWPNLEWVPPEVSVFPVFWLTLPIAAIILIAGMRRIDPIGAPAAILAALLAAAHLRNIGLFFILLPFGLAGPAREVVDRLQRLRLFAVVTGRGRVRPGFISGGVVLVAAFPLLIFLPPRPTFGTGMASTNEPKAAVDFLELEDLGARMYNDVRFGGYLIWRRFPERHVFIDGRNEIYPALMHEIAASMNGSQAWNELLDRHDIDSAFLRYPPTLQKVVYAAEGDREPVEDLRAFSAAYFPKGEWALVYWDDDAMIYLRRTPNYQDVIARLEYRSFHPDDWRYLFAGVFRNRIPLRPILDELGRKLEEDPGCRRARAMYARFASLNRSPDEAGSAGAGAAH